MSSQSELHRKDGTVEVFEEGKLSKAADARGKLIRKTLNEGFLSNLIEDLQQNGAGESELDEAYLELLNELVESVTSEVGRALIGLSVLQLSVKSIAPEQSIRLHKGSTRGGQFSWVEGISMRSLDKQFITPVLRKYGLLKMNADGVMMTRSLAENYPYTTLYKAKLRGAKSQWVELAGALESGAIDPKATLRHLISLLINRSENFKSKSDELLNVIESYLGSTDSTSSDTFNILQTFIHEADYGARAFEVVLHAAYQALDELDMIDGYLKPLSQMRSANKKHGNIGDIEILQSSKGMVIEQAWDAKYGKLDLREEVEELDDKLAYHPECVFAGFIVNLEPTESEALNKRIQEIADNNDCEISIQSFAAWYESIIMSFDEKSRGRFHTLWIRALAESFAQRRRDKAPIDEPCLQWIEALTRTLEKSV